MKLLTFFAACLSITHFAFASDNNEIEFLKLQRVYLASQIPTDQTQMGFESKEEVVQRSKESEFRSPSVSTKNALSCRKVTHLLNDTYSYSDWLDRQIDCNGHCIADATGYSFRHESSTGLLNGYSMGRASYAARFTTRGWVAKMDAASSESIAFRVTSDGLLIGEEITAVGAKGRLELLNYWPPSQAFLKNGTTAISEPDGLAFAYLLCKQIERRY